VEDTARELNLRIAGMDCADCAAKLEGSIARLEGVRQCRVDFMTAGLRVSGPVDREQVVARVRALGYDVAEPGPVAAVEPAGGRWLRLVRQPRNVATLVGAGFILVAFGLRLISSGQAAEPGWLSPLLFGLGGLSGLWFPARAGWATLRSGQGLDMNVLMTVAALGAFAIGEYAEAATVIVLFSLGEALEGYTVDRARDSIRSLMHLAPTEATVVRECVDCQECQGRPLPDGSGLYRSGACPWCGAEEQRVAVETLRVGDRVIVKPGERIPMDGTVLRGRSAVNQAPITGESLPVEKLPASQVFAGSINGDGVLELEVTRLAADNTLSRLIYLVEQAQTQKNRAQRFVDRFARVYTPAVVGAAALAALLPPLAWGAPFLDTASEHGWLYRALTMLVIACPCALVIATPVTVVSGIAAAARRGVLIKGGTPLEALGRVRVVAFDKTGTLTQGQPQLMETACADACCASGNGAEAAADCQHCDDMLAVAAALERYSSHPLARAVTATAEQRALPRLAAEGVENLPGQGVRGRVGERQVVVGSHGLFHDERLHQSELCERLAAAEANGHTTLLVQDGGALRGYLAFSDPPRHTSRDMLAALRKAGVLRTVMLTGDNPGVAGSVADELGIDDVRAGLMPENKVDAVRNLLTTYGDQVAMVGDGVNDAPALAAATVGIAMGAGGTAQALETADVALMADDLLQLPAAIRLGRRVSRSVRFNIGFALAIKAVFLGAAVLGVATLWMAVFADMGASLLVTLNGMRLLRR